MKSFAEQKLDLQIKVSTLSDQLFQEVCQSGSRVLHLTSECYDYHSLVIEDKKLGLAKEIHQDKMREYFKKFLRS